MTMMSIGIGLGVGALGTGANYLMAQSNKPKAYNPGANNKLALQNQQAIEDLTAKYMGQVSGFANTFLGQERALAKTYKTDGTGASTNYLTNTGNALSAYGTDINNLANAAPQNALNAAQAGLAFNAANLDGYGATADALSNMSQQTRMGMMAAAMPTWNQQLAQGNKNASDMQQGLIPADVQAALARTSGFQALGSGVGSGSGLGRNLVARDLGLNSMQLQQQGTAQAQNLANTQYGMAVNGLQTNAGVIMQNNGVNSGQAMNAAALGTNLAATGLQTGIAGRLSTQGTNFGGLMSMYGNMYNTGVSAEQAAMNAQAMAAAAAMQANSGAITGNYQTQMNGNLMNYQSNNALSNWQNSQNQQLISGLTSTAGNFVGSGGLNYLSGIGNGGMMSNGFLTTQQQAQDYYGAGANVSSYNMPGGGKGWYNQYYS